MLRKERFICQDIAHAIVSTIDAVVVIINVVVVTIDVVVITDVDREDVISQAL
ncbi:hypothetical protein [Clostridium tepidiprofundi]|uniref:hypothetical protein n=1 Tax=Clostridium tepidiprofundi TaxID=420412 RepID=UPI00137B5BC0|nr:hypothetical protein [Clostridium tepidiprofundi]